MKKVCPKCHSPLQAVVHATYEFDGAVRERISEHSSENINAIMCSCCDFMRVKDVHNLELYFTKEQDNAQI